MKDGNVMGKYFCVFLAGIIFGIMVTGIVILSIMDNRIDNIQPTIKELNDSMMIFVEKIRDNTDIIKKNNTLSGNTKIIMKAVIDMGMEEINDYDEAFSDSAYIGL